VVYAFKHLGMKGSLYHGTAQELFCNRWYYGICLHKAW